MHVSRANLTNTGNSFSDKADLLAGERQKVVNLYLREEKEGAP